MAKSIVVTGAKEFKKFLKKYPSECLKASDKIMKKYAPKIEVEAKQNHAFNRTTKNARKGKYRPTGNTERSIQAFVRFNTLTFWINPDLVTMKNGFNVGWGQNDGTKDGYSQGKISPKGTSSGGRGGIKADDFMGRAWDKYFDNMLREMYNIPAELDRTR